jgi:molecular chaperone GrpE
VNDDQNRSDDDAYVLEDDGASVEQIEREMKEAAQAAAGQTDPPPAEAAAAAVEQDLREFKDRYVRTLADFENFRKRSEREKQDYFKYAMFGVIKDLLPVLDDFERALQLAEEGDEFHRGVEFIYKQLVGVLRRHGVRVVDESGVRFDPNFHEAVMTEEDPSVPSHTVLAVLRKGYFLHDRLLRPASVKVATGGPEE